MKTFRAIIASLLFFSSSALADNYQYLTVSQPDGDTSFIVTSIQKITFDAGNMLLYLTDGSTQTLPLNSLSKMFFSAESSGIATVTQMQSKIQFTDGVLRATVAPGESVMIYNMKGEQVFSINESGTFDLKTLTKGVYIIKIGNETKKVINK